MILASVSTGWSNTASAEEIDPELMEGDSTDNFIFGSFDSKSSDIYKKLQEQVKKLGSYKILEDYTFVDELTSVNCLDTTCNLTVLVRSNYYLYMQTVPQKENSFNVININIDACGWKYHEDAFMLIPKDKYDKDELLDLYKTFNVKGKVTKTIYLCK
jgi:FlaG/FlaF family flagellin (archaellin)